jgi:hypothetical protein
VEMTNERLLQLLTENKIEGVSIKGAAVWIHLNGNSAILIHENASPGMTNGLVVRTTLSKVGPDPGPHEKLNEPLGEVPDFLRDRQSRTGEFKLASNDLPESISSGEKVVLSFVGKGDTTVELDGLEDMENQLEPDEQTQRQTVIPIRVKRTVPNELTGHEGRDARGSDYWLHKDIMDED